MTEKTFAGKVAIVTGSTQGLGEACARLLVARGLDGIVVTGRDIRRGEQVAASLETAGAKALFVPADLADLGATRRIVARADERFGRVDILVNAAALTDRGTILDTTPELFDKMYDINVRAPFFLMQDTIKIMKREKIQGAIVNILSISAHGGQSFLTAYSSSKLALGGVTKNVAFSMLGDRIRVNGLNIGWMDTPGEHAIQQRAHGAQDGWLETAEAGKPFGRLLKPDEVARAVAFLCSAESGLMTGSLIDFDQNIVGCWNDAPRHPTM